MGEPVSRGRDNESNAVATGGLSRWVRLSVAVALGAVFGLVIPPTAGSASTDGCPPDPGYSFVNVKNNYVDIVPPASGAPGVPLTISLQAGLGVTGTVGGSVSGDVSAIVAGAKAEVNASISLSWTASVTYTGGPWTVPSGVKI